MRHRAWFITIFLLAFFVADVFAAPPPTVAADQHPSIFFDYSIKNNHNQLLILADRPITKYRSFSLENPPRLVLDIPGFSLLEDVVGLPINRKELTRIRIARHPDKVRFVFDLTDVPVKHEIFKVKNGIRMVVVPAPKPAKVMAPGNKAKKAIKAPAKPPRTEGIPLNSHAIDEIFGDQRITILFHRAPLSEFFAFVSGKIGKKIIVDPKIKNTISLTLTDATLSEVVREICAAYRLTIIKEEGNLSVQVRTVAPAQ